MLCNSKTQKLHWNIGDKSLHLIHSSLLLSDTIVSLQAARVIHTPSTEINAKMNCVCQQIKYAM